MLKETFSQLVLKYNNDLSIARELWDEIAIKYSEKNRYYHSLGHLNNLIVELKEVKDFIKDWDATLFAAFYHDIIYFSSDNEGKSAAFAKERLESLGVPKDQISKCVDLILATKSHQKSDDQDINYFTDADLSILGQETAEYIIYLKNIRNEYSNVPKHLFENSRKNMAERFLEKDRIFKTEYFYKKYEAQARKNLRQELEN